MRPIYTLSDLDTMALGGAVTLVRVDFNVPLDDGRVMDDTRIRAALPTINTLTNAGARVVLLSHCGRPKGEPNPKYSLRPVAGALGELLGQEVGFAGDCIGPEAQTAIEAIEPGRICLLENLRYHAGETKNDPVFADALAQLGDVYVDDAFGTAHRAHASVVGIPERLERRAAGELMVSEVAALSRLLDAPERPFAAIVGGAKIGSKVGTVQNLLPRIDVLILGGGMANTFLAARGCDMAQSLVEQDKIGVAEAILADASGRGIRVMLPTDVVITDSLDSMGSIETVAVDSIPAGRMAVDIGQTTRNGATEMLSGCRTALWNGPMGVFENPPFDAGTVSIAGAVADCPGYSVIGGGETVAAAKRAGVLERFGHVSTGGGASLGFLAGKTLPGVAVLEKRE